MCASLLEQSPIQNKNSSDTVRRAVSPTLPSIITGSTLVSRVPWGPLSVSQWLMFTHYLLKQFPPQWVQYSQCCQLADTYLTSGWRTELNSNFYTHDFFNTSIWIQQSSNGLRMQPKPKHCLLSSHELLLLLCFISGLLRGRSPSPVARPCRALQHLSKLFPVAVTHNSVSLLITVHLFWSSVS